MSDLPSQMTLLASPQADAGHGGEMRALTKEALELESVALLALSSTNGIGYRSLHRWVKSGRTLMYLAQLELAGVRAEVRAAGVPRLAAPVEKFCSGRGRALAVARNELDKLVGDGIRIVHRGDTAFPERLGDAPSGPAWLFVEGDVERLNGPTVTLVGTRKATKVGLFCAEFICRLLEGTDITTVSGLAVGIDQAVHRGSVRSRLPTIAVLPTPLDREYPSNSMGLRREIVSAGGCVVSEYPPGEGVSRENFVWRNRIQAALANVLIPLEWKLRSGTAHTVDFALKAGQTVVGLQMGSQLSDENQFLREAGAQVFRVPHRAEELLHFLCKNME